MKIKVKLPIILGLGFLLSGIILIGLSVLYESTLLLLVSLAVTFWGSLLLYVKPTKYVKSILLDSTALSSLEALDQLISGLKYKGKGIYLPPKSLEEIKGGRVFIPKNETITIQLIENEKAQQVLLGNPDGIYLIPPGVELANLFEKELGKNFGEVSPKYLAENLPKVFIEDLEIAKNCEISIKKDQISAKISGIAYDFLCERLCEKSAICSTVGCPFCSAIACALTRSTGKQVVIEETSFSKEAKVVQVKYKILGEQ
jgi:hypothetical protein